MRAYTHVCVISSPLILKFNSSLYFFVTKYITLPYITQHHIIQERDWAHSKGSLKGKWRTNTSKKNAEGRRQERHRIHRHVPRWEEKRRWGSPPPSFLPLPSLPPYSRAIHYCLISFLLSFFHTHLLFQWQYHSIFCFCDICEFLTRYFSLAADEARTAEREQEDAATAKVKRDRLARVAADNEKSSCRAGRTGDTS